MREKIQLGFGALVLVCGLSYAAYDFLSGGSVPLGGECLNDGRCESGTCLHFDTGSFCSEICGSECPTGFTCEVISVTLDNAAGSHDMEAPYCIPNDE